MPPATAPRSTSLQAPRARFSVASPSLIRLSRNLNEVELISTLIPKQQFLIKTPELAKIANLNVDPKSYWLYTNDPFDNQKRNEAFETYGFVKGLEVLAGGKL